MSEIIEAHWILSCGMEWSEADAKLNHLVEMLNECLYKEPYSEEELNHIYCNYNKLDKDPYLDIAIRRLLFSIYNTRDIEKIVNMFKKEKEYFLGNPYGPFIHVLNQKFEDKKDVITYMHKEFEKFINDKFNCGGYALEIFDWVYHTDRDNDVIVTKLLDNPSVRLLGETPLLDDEYLVVFDAANYHFIKHKDGKFIEKMR